MRSRGRSLRTGLLVLAVAGATAADATTAPAGEPSPEYKAALKRTLELRRGRRRMDAGPPVGLIVPYPMPPVLVIRHTRETHEEIGALLGVLRHGGR
jgi:hypothetical protein